MDLSTAIEELDALAARNPQSSGEVSLESTGRLRRIVFSNPTARHAFTLEMMAAFGRAVEQLEADQEAAFVVVTSAGGGPFSSGGDLRQVVKALPDGPSAYRMSMAMQTVMVRLACLPLLSVAVLDGVALGGGAELAVACDQRIAGEDGALCFAQGGLGIAPGWGGTRNLCRHTNTSFAASILLGDGWIRPSDDSHGVFAVAGGVATDALARHLARFEETPTGSVRSIKRQLVSARPVRMEHLREDAQAFSERWLSGRHKQAVDRWR